MRDTAALVLIRFSSSHLITISLISMMRQDLWISWWHSSSLADNEKNYLANIIMVKQQKKRLLLGIGKSGAYVFFIPKVERESSCLVCLKVLFDVDVNDVCDVTEVSVNDKSMFMLAPGSGPVTILLRSRLG